MSSGLRGHLMGTVNRETTGAGPHPVGPRAAPGTGAAAHHLPPYVPPCVHPDVPAVACGQPQRPHRAESQGPPATQQAHPCAHINGFEDRTERFGRGGVRGGVRTERQSRVTTARATPTVERTWEGPAGCSSKLRPHTPIPKQPPTCTLFQIACENMRGEQREMGSGHQALALAAVA